MEAVSSLGIAHRSLAPLWIQEVGGRGRKFLRQRLEERDASVEGFSSLGCCVLIRNNFINEPLSCREGGGKA